MKLRTITYRAALNRILNAQKWFDFIGLKKGIDRFLLIIRNLQLITEHYEKGITDRLKDFIKTPEAYYSMTDALSIIDIYDSFSKLKNHQLPRAKLKAILGGPIIPSDEDPSKSTNAARNYLFELQLASIFMQNGISVTHFKDINFDFEDKHYCIECKRLISSSYVDQNITEAIKSINSFSVSDENNRGMIALSIEKLYSIDKYFLNTSNPAKMRREILPIMKSFQQYYGKTWYDVLNMRFTGVILSISGIAAQIETGRLNSVWQLVVLDRFPDSKSYISAEKLQLRRLINIIMRDL